MPDRASHICNEHPHGCPEGAHVRAFYDAIVHGPPCPMPDLLANAELIADLQTKLQQAIERAEAAEALAEQDEHKLTLLKIKCEEYIADCCAGNEEQFCDNYGCSTLRDFLDIINAPAEAQKEEA